MTIKKLQEKKKKKPYDSMFCGMFDIDKEIDRFNKSNGTEDAIVGNMTDTITTSGDAATDSASSSTMGSGDSSSGGMGESMQITEGRYKVKRNIKRYYMRPQNKFLSKKEDILQALAEVNGENCSIYSLKNLENHDDISKLTNSDIIYYYDGGILYDKNKIKILDYDLSVKNEEDRKKFDVDSASDATFEKEYSDRRTERDAEAATIEQEVPEDVEESFNPLDLFFENYDVFGRLVEEKDIVHTCCYCGEEFEGDTTKKTFLDRTGYWCPECEEKFVATDETEEQ